MPPEATRATLHKEELRLLVRAWGRKQDTVRHSVALRDLIEGVPYAEPGEREAVTWDLARRLALAIPDASPEAIARWFAPSLSLMGPDAPTLDSVTDKIQRARRNAYTPAPTDAAPPDAPRVLVTPQGSLYFVQSSQGWDGPYGGDAIDLSIARALEGAPGVELERATPVGPQRKTRAQILTDYGERVSAYGIELGARAHAYDPEARTLIEAAARPRDLAPLTDQDREIAASFLDAIANGDAKIRADLDTWLARLPYLDDTLAALAFLGPPGCGKGLFASACARLWSEDGPTDADDAFGNWNDGILRCPLIFADEKLPTTWQGRDLSAEIRKVLGARTTPIRRRFMPIVAARGCVRMFLAANNDSILSFSHASTEDDIQAISERFYVVRLDRASCQGFLRTFPGAHARLVQGDALARYALALPQPTADARVGRFWIRGPAHDAETIAIRSGAAYALLSWVVSWLQDPRPLTSLVPGAQSHVDAQGHVLVSIGEIGQSWGRYFPGEIPPERSRLAAACRALGVQQRNARGRLWSIRHGPIDTWIRDAGWSAPPVAELVETRLRAPIVSRVS